MHDGAAREWDEEEARREDPENALTLVVAGNAGPAGEWTLASRVSWIWRSDGGRHVFLRIGLPIFATGVLLFLWNYLPIWLGFDTFEVPTFGQDVSYITSHWSYEIWPNLEVTIVDAVVGFVVGNVLATISAVVFSQSKLVEWTFFPLAILIQTIPIVVMAPLLQIVMTVLGLDATASLPVIGMGTWPILFVTVMICFFPTLVNMTVGLQAVDPTLYEFMQLVNSSKLRQRRGLPAKIGAEIVERWRLLWKLRLPSSMPYLFSSFKITSSLSFVGAVVGEFFLANDTGIGGLLNFYNEAINQPGKWAAVIALSTTSMLFFALVVIAERVLVPWREER